MLFITTDREGQENFPPVLLDGGCPRFTRATESGRLASPELGAPVSRLDRSAEPSAEMGLCPVLSTVSTLRAPTRGSDAPSKGTPVLQRGNEGFPSHRGDPQPAFRAQGLVDRCCRRSDSRRQPRYLGP
jgi:hypothetical protein